MYHSKLDKDPMRICSSLMHGTRTSDTDAFKSYIMIRILIHENKTFNVNA